MINSIRNKKGFTLVEIIVVLVIIAILAATTLPALTGYINDAKEKTAISECRTVLVAAQTIASQMSGDGKDAAAIKTQVEKATGTGADAKYPNINGLTGMDLKDTPTASVSDVASVSGKITGFKLKASNGKTVTYDATTTTPTFTIS